MEDDKKRLWAWIAGITATLLFLGVAGWFSRPYYSHYKEKNCLAQAQRFLAQGDYRNALLDARLTLQINPTNVQACKVMAALYDFSRSPLTLDWCQRIVELEPTVTNQLRYASAALHYQSPPFPIAMGILDELPASATNSLDFHRVAAELAWRMNRTTDAQAHFEAASRLDPTNKIYKINLATLQLTSTNAATAATARATLAEFQTDPDFSAPVLRSLIADRLIHHDGIAARNYSDQLLTSRGATLADRLQHLYLLQQFQSPDLPAKLTAVKQQSSTNEIEIAEVALWMAVNGLATNATDWLKTLPPNLQTQPNIRNALATCYLVESNWPALRNIAATGNWDEIEYLRLAYASRAWGQLGDAAVAQGNWHAAVSEAGRHIGALTVLLGQAENWNWEAECEDLLWRIIQQSPRERWAAQELERAYLFSGNTAGICRLSSYQLKFFPDEPSIKNDLAATSLLLKTNLAQASEWAQQVYAQKPDDAIFASTYAYALHLQGRTADGIAVLEKLEPSKLNDPSVALYYGVLFSAQGKTHEAAPYLKLAGSANHLLPEEQTLLKQAEDAK